MASAKERRDLALPDMTEEGEAAFFKLMAQDDALGVVIRAGTYIDYQLHMLIKECVPYPATIDRMKLDYDNKINLAIALGLDPRFGSPLKAVGKVRNKFAHRIDAALGDNEANAVFDEMAGEDRAKVHAIYTKMRARYPKWAKRFQSLDPLDRFRLTAITLRNVLVVARIHVAENSAD
jgi:hypothetical protein